MDAEGFLDSHIVALDAIRLGPAEQKSLTQFNGRALERELRKCLAAVSRWPHEQEAEDVAGKPREALRAFATGKWGCGVFGGDPQLKAVLQWMAASVARRPVHFFPFSDGALAAALTALVAALGASARPVSVGLLCTWTGAYKGAVRQLQEHDRPSFFDFLLGELHSHNE